jgi:hypothetical protein
VDEGLRLDETAAGQLMVREYTTKQKIDQEKIQRLRHGMQRAEEGGERGDVRDIDICRAS